MKCPALLRCCVHTLMILTKESSLELSQFYFRTNIHKNSLCVECAVPAQLLHVKLATRGISRVKNGS